MADVFLSYRNTPSRRAFVERLKIALDAYSISAWWDYGLEAGREFEPQILSELAAADLICPIWCKESVRSVWVAKEAQFGLDHGKLLPARLEAVEPPTPFASMQAQDLLGWDGSVESHMVIGFASTVARRLNRPLIPLADKLSALRALSPLEPLERSNKSNHPSVEERWLALEKSLDVRRLDIFIEETPPGTPERFNAREHKLQLEDWSRVDETDLAAIRKFLSTNPFPELGRLAHARSKQAMASNELLRLRDARSPDGTAERLGFFVKAYWALFRHLSVQLTIVDEAMVELTTVTRGQTHEEVLDLFDLMLSKALDAVCFGGIEEVIVSREVVEGRARPLQIYSERR